MGLLLSCQEGSGAAQEQGGKADGAGKEQRKGLLAVADLTLWMRSSPQDLYIIFSLRFRKERDCSEQLDRWAEYFGCKGPSKKPEISSKGDCSFSPISALSSKGFTPAPTFWYIVGQQQFLARVFPPASLGRRLMFLLEQPCIGHCVPQEPWFPQLSTNNI